LEDKADGDPAAQEDEDDIIDDDELNQILHRHDHELEVFAQVDLEKEKEDLEWWHRIGGRGSKVERLIQDSELPDIYQRDDYAPYNSEDEHEYGRGQRSREEIDYEDRPSDDELMDVSGTGHYETPLINSCFLHSPW
jgi:ATP-dependent helicase STH1/SNF2